MATGTSRVLHTACTSSTYLERVLVGRDVQPQPIWEEHSVRIHLPMQHGRAPPDMHRTTSSHCGSRDGTSSTRSHTAHDISTLRHANEACQRHTASYLHAHSHACFNGRLRFRSELCARSAICGLSCGAGSQHWRGAKAPQTMCMCARRVAVVETACNTPWHGPDVSSSSALSWLRPQSPACAHGGGWQAPPKKWGPTLVPSLAFRDDTLPLLRQMASIYRTTTWS